MKGLAERIESAIQLLNEAPWPAVWTPSLGFIDPRKMTGYVGKTDPDTKKSKQKPHPKGEPNEMTYKFPDNSLNYGIPPYLPETPQKRAVVKSNSASQFGYAAQGAAPIGSWP